MMIIAAILALFGAIRLFRRTGPAAIDRANGGGSIP